MAEEAFKAGFNAYGAKFAAHYTTASRVFLDAWDNFEPSEAIKELLD